MRWMFVHLSFLLFIHHKFMSAHTSAPWRQFGLRSSLHLVLVGHTIAFCVHSVTLQPLLGFSNYFAQSVHHIEIIYGGHISHVLGPRSRSHHSTVCANLLLSQYYIVYGFVNNSYLYKLLFILQMVTHTREQP